MLGKYTCSPDYYAITHGLVIDEPWISKILAGEKIWEMRTTSSQKRGVIALIKKGSKQVVGIATLQEVEGPLTEAELGQHEDKHQIPANIYRQEGYKWYYAWKLSGVLVFDKPVPYVHKSGAVIWVELDEKCRYEIASRINQSKTGCATGTDICNTQVEDEQIISLLSGDKVGQQINVSNALGKRVPYAKDGSYFCAEKCFRSGSYTVGEKGDERKFCRYEDALDYLKSMPKAKWRRPNEKNNWGIVTAVEWKIPNP